MAFNRQTLLSTITARASITQAQTVISFPIHHIESIPKITHQVSSVSQRSNRSPVPDRISEHLSCNDSLETSRSSSMRRRSTSVLSERKSPLIVDRSFRSEPRDRRIESSRAETEGQPSRHSTLLEDAPLDIRQAIEHSLETIREMRLSRPHPRSLVEDNQKMSLTSRPRRDSALSMTDRELARTTTMENYTGPSAEEDIFHYSPSKRQQTVSSGSWQNLSENALQQSLLQTIEERCTSMETAMNERVRLLEQRYRTIRPISETKHSRPVTKGVQVELQPVLTSREIEERDERDMKADMLDTLMAELDINDLRTFQQSVHAWRARSRLLTEVRCFVDGVEKVIWNTPYVPLSSICHIGHEDNRQVGLVEDEMMCESHRVRYERALLDAERDKANALERPPYTRERLDATFDRLTRWSHSVRHPH
ncbi:hypothetical protein F4703DRAFT_1818278 [Phycomyces blakesleeanus]